MFRIKFQGESLETFFLYEVIQHDLSADLGVIGPPGPARSVTVNTCVAFKMFFAKRLFSLYLQQVIISIS